MRAESFIYFSLFPEPAAQSLAYRRCFSKCLLTRIIDCGPLIIPSHSDCVHLPWDALVKCLLNITFSELTTHTSISFRWLVSSALLGSQKCSQILGVGPLSSLPPHFLYYYYYYYYLFLAALGLHCCAWAFSSCSEQGLLFVAVRVLLIVVASLVVEHGL